MERAAIGPMTANAGDHRAEPARPLVVQARESSPFTRKCRRITAQAKSRPSLHGGPGADEQDATIRPGDRRSAAPGSDVPDRRTRQPVLAASSAQVTVINGSSGLSVEEEYVRELLTGGGTASTARGAWLTAPPWPSPKRRSDKRVTAHDQPYTSIPVCPKLSSRGLRPERDFSHFL